MKVMRKIIEINEALCNGCGQCVVACAEGTLDIVNGKAKVVSDNLCDGLGACIGECPTGALKIIEREADDFDEEAVEKRLNAMGRAPAKPHAAVPCGCPSSQMMSFSPKAAPAESGTPVSSALTHWPVKIRLVPPNAPFLKGADLLVLADCAAVASPDIHREFLPGKVVMSGCPKFDEAPQYVEKMTQVCREGGINSLTVVIMEVPCCTGLHTIVRKGREASGMSIPLTEVIIDRQGRIKETRAVP